MNQTNEYQGLRFERRTRLASPQVTATAIGGVIFTLAWWILPPAAVYWLTLIALLALIWTAHFGWREALSQLLRWLSTMERR